VTRDERKRARLERERTVELMWEDGWSTPEIAETLGTTKRTVSVLVQEMRRAGKHLEKRR